MDPALAALLGALGGAAVSTGNQVYLDWRRRNADDRAARERDKRALRLAARLVMEELADSLQLVADAGRSRRYWAAPRNLSTDVWGQYRTDIAALIQYPTEWRRITAAFDAINNLNWTVQHRRHHSQEVATTVKGARVESADGTRRVWRAIRDAIEALEGAIEVQGAASRLLADRADEEQLYWPFGDEDDFDLLAARQADEERRQEESQPFR